MDPYLLSKKAYAPSVQSLGCFLNLQLRTGAVLAARLPSTSAEINLASVGTIADVTLRPRPNIAT